MPKRTATGSKSNQEQRRLQREQDEIQTRRLEEKIAQVNLQESYNSKKQLGSNPRDEGDDGEYAIKRHTIQHHHSVAVPAVFFNPPYYNHPVFHEKPLQYSLADPRDILQQFTVENVKRVVKEKHWDFFPYNLVYNSVSNTLEYEPKFQQPLRSARNRKLATKHKDGQDKKASIKEIRVSNQTQPTNRTEAPAVSKHALKITEKAPEGHGKNLNITITANHTINQYVTDLPQSANQSTTTGENTRDEVEYEYDDDDLLVDEQPPKPPGASREPDEAPEDLRWDLGTLGWQFNRTASNNGEGVFVNMLKVRRGGVAIAGPGGIATAGTGGTAIVGPGGSKGSPEVGGVAIAAAGADDEDESNDRPVVTALMQQANKRNRTRPGLFPNRWRPPREGRAISLALLVH